MPTLLFVSAGILSFFRLFSLVSAFTFTFGTPSECDSLPLTWSGGTPPFQLLIIPVFGTPRNISIPNSAFSNGNGSYSFPLPLAKDQQMVLTMSDATGFNTGGTSNVLTVAASKGGSCNSKDPGVAFQFELNSALQQCRPFVFSGYSGATQPVTIYAVIPGGSAITLNPPTGDTFFQWTASAARGTSIIFLMVDALGRQGGSSDVRSVGSSDDTSCLNGQSPSSTSSPPTPSTTEAPSSASNSAPPATTSSTSTGNGISIAAVAGTVIGALLFLAVLITLGLFFLRRRHEKKHSPSKRHSIRMDSEAELASRYIANPTDASYPYTPSTSRPTNGNLFLDYPLPSSQHLPPSSYHQSVYSQPSMYPPSEYQPSLPYADVDPQDRPSQLYPPTPHQTYRISDSSSIDPFNPSAPPMLPGAESERQPLRDSEQATSRSSSSAAQRKAAMAGVTPYTPSRFVMHTDADDILPPPNEEGVIELPPQYTERRNAPAPDAGHRPGAPHS